MAIVLAAAVAATARSETPPVDVLEVAPVWAGHRVGFSLLTVNDRQLVGFYDADRRLTVAVRSLDEKDWVFVPLPRHTGWDSHNSIEIAVDRDGFVHLTADMHTSPLVYFRSRHPLREPFTTDSFEPLHHMTGDQERRVTYPRFLHDDAGDLVFMYRYGSSGDGDQILNRYDTTTRQWHRLLDQPLTCGRVGDATMNAYLHGPVRGPDGFFHLAWVWRDTPDCETCHDVCYARSRDLVHWERSDGTPLGLPITAATCEVVDPVPAGGGLLNGLLRIGFDAAGRPVLSYHKYDDMGRSQIFTARLEDGRWRIRQTSDWSERIAFSGRGSIGLEASVGSVTLADDGTLLLDHRTPTAGGTWQLDRETLAAVGLAAPRRRTPVPLGRVESPWPGMQVRWQNDSGEATPGRKFMLRWETLAPNRDRPRAEPLPPPSMLRVIENAD
ncbi:MAG: BNR repeat-containing protein [Pirellulales bacterium]